MKRAQTTSGVRVRHVTASETAKRVAVKKHLTKGLIKNREQKMNMLRIEQRLEQEIEANKAEL